MPAESQAARARDTQCVTSAVPGEHDRLLYTEHVQGTKTGIGFKSQNFML